MFSRDRNVYMDRDTRFNLFTINSMINSDLETSLRRLENGEYSEIQNNNFQNIAKSVMPLELVQKLTVKVTS